MRSSFYTIGQIANIFNVKTDTIRYYENIGLLRCDFRDLHNNYRQYSSNELRRLEFIFLAKKLGFSLTEIKELLIIQEHESSCCETKEMIEKKINIIENKLDVLNSYKLQLQAQLKHCKENRDSQCHIFDSLDCK